jgi:CRP-like cAMP-binding protein
LSQIQQSTVQNRLLKALSTDDFALLQPHLQPQAVHLHQMMIAPYASIEQLFFPESGFTSVVSEDAGNKIEVGMIGREGLVGAAPLLLGADRSPYEHFIQLEGEVLCIGAEEITTAFRQSPSLQRLLLRYTQTLMVQTAQTAFVNAAYHIEARLARWLLMCQDRIGGEVIVLTHEFLSMMLGVQRTSVTLTLQTLEGNSLIRARRGRIEIRDREQLKLTAGKGYGVAESEYARLIEGA